MNDEHLKKIIDYIINNSTKNIQRVDDKLSSVTSYTIPADTLHFHSIKQALEL